MQHTHPSISGYFQLHAPLKDYVLLRQIRANLNLIMNSGKRCLERFFSVPFCVFPGFVTFFPGGQIDNNGGQRGQINNPGFVMVFPGDKQTTMGGQISINTQGKLHKQRLPLNELTLEINSRNMDRTQGALFLFYTSFMHQASIHVSREPRCYFGPSLATVVYPHVTYL